MKEPRTGAGTGRRRILGWGLGGALFLAVGLLVHFSVGWRDLLSPWREIPPGGLALALLLVLASYALRTVRIHQYFAPDTTGAFLRSFRLILLHNLFNNMLPMRSGEASFPILMKRDFRVPFSRSVPGLFYLRLLDLHFLLLLGALVFAPGRGILGWAVPVFLFPLPILGFLLQGWIQARVARGAVDSGKTVTWLDGLPRSPALFLGSWLWTAVNWSAKLLVFAWILRAFIPLTYSTALLGSITGELSSVLPIHGLAGAGTYEAGIMAGLLPLGVEMETALAGAVNLHLFVLGASILSGLLALALPVGTGTRGRPDAPGKDTGEPEARS